MNELILAGCRLEPLGSLLKALGVLRLLGEQCDPDARGSWRGDTFVLTTGMGSDELIDFLVDGYRPTPVVSPWNGGSGFSQGGSSPAAEAAIGVIEGSDTDRLLDYRAAIAAARCVMVDAESVDAKTRKEYIIDRCRSTLPDAALGWLDAAVVLADDGVAYPPVLGTGGNLGRLDLSSNFADRLADVLCLRSGRGAPTRDRSVGWLHGSLFGDAVEPWVRASVGQFDPGAAGGANSSWRGSADSLVNPWDYVLLVEGAQLFASAAARRLGTDGNGRAAVPFTVSLSRVGYSSAASDEGARGETWFPLWTRPATGQEIRHLLGEGRAEWRGHQARSGLDMVRAAASLGVDRGVSAFMRYAFIERMGQSNLAVPIGIVPVRGRVEVPVLAQLDGWLDSVRRGVDPPAAVISALRRVDSAIFEVSLRGGPRLLQEVLASVAHLESAVARSSRFREKARIAPVTSARAAEWLAPLDDGSPEFRVAMSLASQRDADGASLRQLLHPVSSDPHSRRLAFVEIAQVRGVEVRPLVDVLADALIRRAVTGGTVGAAGRGAERMVGVPLAFAWRIGASMADVGAFVAGSLDEERIGRLLSALLLLDWRARVDVVLRRPEDEGEQRHRVPAWAILAPFFHGRSLEPDGRTVDLVPQPTWPARLTRGQVGSVLDEALQRLRMAPLDPAPSEAAAIARASPTGARLAAALLCPLTSFGAASLLRQVVPQPIS